jgi:hypothetical protein
MNLLVPNNHSDITIKKVNEVFKDTKFVFGTIEYFEREALKTDHVARTEWEDIDARVEHHMISFKPPILGVPRAEGIKTRLGVDFKLPRDRTQNDIFFRPPKIENVESFYFSTQDDVSIHFNEVTKFVFLQLGRCWVGLNSYRDFWLRFFHRKKKLRLETSKPGKNMQKIISALGGLEGARILKLGATRKLLFELQSDKPLLIDTTNKILGMNWKGIGHDYGLHRLDQKNILEYLCLNRILRQGYMLECTECMNQKWYALDEIGSRWKCDFCEALLPTPLLKKNLHAVKANGLFQISGGAYGAFTSILTLWRFSNSFGRRGDINHLSFVLKDEKKNEVLECDLLLSIREMDESITVICECKSSAGKLTEKDYSQALKLKDMIGAEEVFICFSFLISKIEGDLKEQLIKFHKIYPKLIILGLDELEPYETWDCFPEEHKYIRNVEHLSEASLEKYLGITWSDAETPQNF